ncbi:amidohydrolase family protein [Paenibacillus mesophilus]|uniref:amidohydrolase family protein n=1 Tax=Paenibacillus mesophilus TaxID=2582849 RepID=UPI00110E7F5F|nr:amidohydrolase family protein [Paenibacillus mesophilus]TMV50153.1 amidohydrolase family protein [Paenibacillus mesophilus]
MIGGSYWLTNVRMESGYRFENGEVVATETEIGSVRIESGTFAEIVRSDAPMHSDLPKYDANRLLLLPSFREAHIHLDKTYYGGEWKAVRPAASIYERIEEERRLLPQLLPEAQHRAERLLELVFGFGSTHVRSHCNIEPVSGLRNLEATMRAIDTYSGKLSHEIVAFPQHGLLRSGSVELVREAMRNGATLVGGLDPATVDDDMEKSLQTIIEIAVDANAGIDIHLHDRGEPGKKVLLRLAELTEEAGLQGKVTVSHAFWFAAAPKEEAEEMAGRFAELGIAVASTVPIGRTIMPIPMLHDKGVRVGLGTDSVTDHWSPFGTGDNLEKAGRLAELYGYSNEWSLSRSLGFITGGITPLGSDGKRVWPAVGDEASVALVHASCSAEAVARRSQRQAVLYKGRLVSGSLM